MHQGPAVPGLQVRVQELSIGAGSWRAESQELGESSGSGNAAAFTGVVNAAARSAFFLVAHLVLYSAKCVLFDLQWGLHTAGDPESC